MRQGQQNRRGRGRQNTNTNARTGKGQNPLTRSYESNGPDVKIRGTPAHVAEKYISLARDSLSAGDVVMAENYLQHAEHYNRIIMSYREQSQQGSDQGGTNDRYTRHQDQRRSAPQSQQGPASVGDAASDAAASNEPAPYIKGQEPQPSIVDLPPVEAVPTRNGRASGNRSSRSRDDGTRDDARSRRGGGRTARGSGRPPRNKSNESGDETQSRSTATARRRNNDNGAAAESGSKISDGQEPPGFLRNSVAPARRRRKADAEPKPAAVGAAPAREEDGA